MKHLLAFISIFLISSSCFSQRLKTPTLSPFNKISQEIGLTEVSLEYSRPSAKGRLVLGGLVPFGKIWRTGANASTKITLNESAVIGGEPIEQGTYALYTIPRKDVWTVIIHSNIKMRSLAGDIYKVEDDVFRFDVKPQRTEPFVESFTIQFSDLRGSSLNLQLIWENTLIIIPVEVEVDQKIDEQMTEFMKDPGNIPARTYFEAAQYYLNNDKDLDEALAYIEAALNKSPKNFRYGLLKSKIQSETGDSQAAILTINLANTWATAAQNDNYIEQTALFRESLLERK